MPEILNPQIKLTRDRIAAFRAVDRLFTFLAALNSTMMKVTLYETRSEEFRSCVTAELTSGMLIISGYDAGQSVQKFWGHEEYDYGCTVSKEDMPAVYALFRLESGQEEMLLSELQRQFGHSKCFMDLTIFFSGGNIPMGPAAQV